jgi:hypothetical protein
MRTLSELVRYAALCSPRLLTYAEPAAPRTKPLGKSEPRGEPLCAVLAASTLPHDADCPRGLTVVGWPWSSKPAASDGEGKRAVGPVGAGDARMGTSAVCGMKYGMSGVRGEEGKTAKRTAGGRCNRRVMRRAGDVSGG